MLCLNSSSLKFSLVGNTNYLKHFIPTRNAKNQIVIIFVRI